MPVFIDGYNYLDAEDPEQKYFFLSVLDCENHLHMFKAMMFSALVFNYSYI